jgi:hypothetical protein
MRTFKKADPGTSKNMRMGSWNALSSISYE